MVTNDTREAVSGKVTVTDVGSGKVVFKGRYEVGPTGREVIARIPEREGQGILKIDYTGRGGESLNNHYLYGKAPFSLKEYRNLLKKTGIFELKQK